jgi:hypothetical protein
METPTDEDLLFVNLPHNPACDVWDVSYRGAVVARVAERVISQPPFIITWPDNTEIRVNTRDEVVEAILARLRSQGTTRNGAPS